MSNTENYRIIITDRKNVLFSTYAREPLRNLKEAVPDIIFNKPYDKLIIFNEEEYTLQDIYIGELADKIDEFNHVKVLARAISMNMKTYSVFVTYILMVVLPLTINLQ